MDNEILVAVIFVLLGYLNECHIWLFSLYVIVLRTTVTAEELRFEQFCTCILHTCTGVIL